MRVYKYARYNNLPIEFVIEDNGKSVYTSIKRGFQKKIITRTLSTISIN